MLHNPPPDDLAFARQAIGTGDNLSAAATSRRIISSSPTSAEAHHILGLSLFRQGLAQEAKAPAARAVALAPNYAEAHHTLGVIFQKLGNPADAETSLRAALAAKPDYVEALNQLGLLFQDTKNLSEAEAALRQAVALRPDFANAHDNLGFVLREMGRSNEAASSFRQAHSLFEPHLALNPAAGSLARGLNVAWRYVKVSLHILRWLAGAKLGPDALTDYRLLHQATNGKTAIILAAWLQDFLVAKVPRGGGKVKYSPGSTKKTFPR